MKFDYLALAWSKSTTLGNSPMNSVEEKGCCVLEKSIINQIFRWPKFFLNNAPLHWVSERQKIVKTSTCGSKIGCVKSCNWINDGSNAQNWQNTVQWVITESMKHVLWTFWHSNPSSPPRSTVMCSKKSLGDQAFHALVKSILFRNLCGNTEHWQTTLGLSFLCVARG